MTVSLDKDKIETLRQQLFEANRVSHFVIIEARAKVSGATTEIVTDYNNYLNMRQENGASFDFSILRDILPITDNLVYWAVAQQKLHSIVDEESPERDEAINDLEMYTQKVMEDNKL
ncbi:hypothetical protein PL11_004570 [Lentilactobacillus curieae]|uniref:Uncharacterized protein n=1 Tax=Lentilactobacillus curieae TaxID=1138822 RepID=A0A1S6QI19_9LACO|nr:hypothetical protein [Lentilactobacillus curieae]AQW21250.1 hypothetical protein PL11_004570 [Lentilactobacillus curieae]